ncbi:hypothetical protein F0562_022098 [Nyssa sinensis]|uniref:DUF3741 domain-containing protein n=1 Tax=Nyssa sinensis TaxID=561372 RepID=A0A5J5BKQ9_9ASTE|nr:hypothetical protein F0562_022098 [Nyssa sinensis]
MKFLSSSSSSTSSTTATSIDGAGCLTGVLRRLFCFNSLPTYPSDQIKVTVVKSVEYDKLQCLETEEKVAGSATPGIVARLMGLEPLRRIDVDKIQMTPNPISRSRSMNSVETLKEFESEVGRHQRFKTSLSFREASTFLELEDDKFFILTFKNGVEIMEMGSKVRKSDTGFGELKPRKKKGCKNREENVPEKKNKECQETNEVVLDEKQNRRINCRSSSSNVRRRTKNSDGNLHVAMEAVKMWKPISHEGKSDGGRSRKKKKKGNVSVAKRVESNSGNSSPVSVLDSADIIDPQVHTSEEDSRLTSSNSRRKLSAELENYELSSPCNTQSSISGDKEMKIIEEKCQGLKKKDYQSQNNVERWSEICKMAGRDIMESSWTYREVWKFEDFEDIGADFGLQILEQLLNELAEQI